MANTREIERMKRRLKKEAEADHFTRSQKADLAAYARKSNAKIRESHTSKAAKRDLFTKRRRLPGSAFSRRG